MRNEVIAIKASEVSNLMKLLQSPTTDIQVTIAQLVLLLFS